MLNPFQGIFVLTLERMKQYTNRNKTRQLGGLLLEAVMLFFVFTYTWSESNFIDQYTQGALNIRLAPVEQIAFRNTEFLLRFISKIQISAGDFTTAVIGLVCLAIGDAKGFSINRSLYNTFYTHTTANAP